MPNPKPMRRVCAAALIALLGGSVFTAVQAEAFPKRRLSIVSTPAGSGPYAQAARDLSPVSVIGFSLVPLEQDSASETQMPDAGLSDDTDFDADAAWPESDTDGEKSVAEQAREAALAFDLVAAAELWRREADRVLRTADTVLFPRRTAETLMEAGAASAAAGETDLALAYFRKSIAVDGDIEPGPEISPDAKALFRRAVAEGPSVPEPPRQAVLKAICDAEGTDGVLWTAVGMDNGEWTVLFRTYRRRGGESAGEVEMRRYAAPLDKSETTAERARLEQIAAVRPVGVVAPSPALPNKETSQTDEVRKPWYKKWWFYTAVGGVLIAGGVVGVAVWAASREETAEITVNY